jgi:tryptophan 2,3-dioxygenase
MTAKPHDPAADGAQMSFAGRMSYGDYLCIDDILAAQRPRSQAHDELLFIIQHQTSELWMKLALHEISSAMAAIRSGELQPAFKMLSRTSRIFEQLNSAWDVLRTMTPSDYAELRPHLGESSGFQSWQYRAIEFLIGNRNHAMLKPHEHRPDIITRLEAILAGPSLYQVAIGVLGREGFDLGSEEKEQNFRETRAFNPKVMEAWAEIYRNPQKYWTCYELAEKLVDLEDYFRRWRFNHVTTVERIIGLKRGTGGTSGVSYLRRMLEVVLFPELWQVRTTL